MDSVAEMVIAARKKYDNNYLKFQSIFNIPLKNYWDKLFAFDVIGFDKFLETPDGVSTHDWILQKYGQNAVNLVLDLLFQAPE